MATLYYAETFHIAQTQTEIPFQTQIPTVPIFGADIHTQLRIQVCVRQCKKVISI